MSVRDGERARVAGGLTCLLLSAALAGVALAGRAPAQASAPAVPVRVAGVGVDTGAGAQATTAALALAWGQAALELELDGRVLSGTRASWGGRIEAEALEAQLVQAGDPTSLMRRYHAQLHPGAPLELSPAVRMDAAATLARLVEEKDHLDVQPADARLEPRTGRVIAERTGRALDVHGTLDALLAAMRTGAPRVRARVQLQPPHRTAHDLEGIRIEATLGTFETRYNPSATVAERTHNLRVAAGRVDGTVLMPGETFDFNAVVGERNEANGFRPAPQIADGELVDGIGGGTCQIAGTLHAAAFFAGLPVGTRSPHSRPSSYIFMGLDAAVVYPTVNLEFTNDTGAPVVLGMTVEGGVVRAEIRGAHQRRMVTFVRRIEEALPFRERVESDPTLPLGVRVLQQRGVPGFRVVRFRVVRDVEQNQARRQRLEDRYPPTDQIWRVGSGPPAPTGFAQPPGDTHSEYTTDEYLSVTQGATIEGSETTRRGGRMTEPGWTASMVAR